MKSDKLREATEVAIPLVLVVLLVVACLWILGPFLEIVLWSIILAMAGEGPYERSVTALGGRRKLTAVLAVLLTLVALFVPAVLLSETLLSGARHFADQIASGELSLPPPSEGVAEWPIVGERLYAAWQLASDNLAEALRRLTPQLEAMSRWLLGAAASAGVAMLQFVASVIIAAVLLVYGQGRKNAVDRFARRVAPDRGPKFAELARGTVRSVVLGVVGVATIQGLLAGLSFLIAGIPGAGLWALLVVVAAVVQLPVALVLIIPVLLSFSILSTPLAIAFTVWCLIVSLIDNVLKPILFGRGADVPALVIFLGAIGGMLAMGLIGLFLGAVILALGYELYTAWVSGIEEPDEAASASVTT